MKCEHKHCNLLGHALISQCNFCCLQLKPLSNIVIDTKNKVCEFEVLISNVLIPGLKDPAFSINALIFT